MGCGEGALLRPGNGEVVDRGLHLADGFPFSNESINFLEGRLLDPNLSTGRADLGRHVLENVQVGPTTFLVGNGGLPELAAADRATLFRKFGLGRHGLFPLLSLGGFAFLVQGSSHLRGSSQ